MSRHQAVKSLKLSAFPRVSSRNIYCFFCRIEKERKYYTELFERAAPRSHLCLDLPCLGASLPTRPADTWGSSSACPRPWYHGRRESRSRQGSGCSAGFLYEACWPTAQRDGQTPASGGSQPCSYIPGALLGWVGGWLRSPLPWKASSSSVAPKCTFSASGGQASSRWWLQLSPVLAAGPPLPPCTGLSLWTFC